MERIDPETLAVVYPTPVVRGCQITRMKERELGRFRLTPETAFSLGVENIGMFIGGCRNLVQIVNRVREMDRHTCGGQWVVVLANRSLAAEFYEEWFEYAGYLNPKAVPDVWTGNKVSLCLPETLSRLEAYQQTRGDVAGIVLVDSQCIIHRARGFWRGNFRVHHDRPQLIVDFRSRLSIGRWAPPVFFLTERPAKSVPTTSMRRAYCLEAFRFLDGRTLSCYPLPGELLGPHASTARERNSTACAC